MVLFFSYLLTSVLFLSTQISLYLIILRWKRDLGSLIPRIWATE